MSWVEGNKNCFYSNDVFYFNFYIFSVLQRKLFIVWIVRVTPLLIHTPFWKNLLHNHKNSLNGKNYSKEYMNSKSKQMLNKFALSLNAECIFHYFRNYLITQTWCSGMYSEVFFSKRKAVTIILSTYLVSSHFYRSTWYVGWGRFSL